MTPRGARQPPPLPRSPYTASAMSAAHQALAELPNRLAHSLSVARYIQERLKTNGDPAWRDRLIAAGVVHDIGYGAPRTGMHAIDGALLLERSWPALADLAPLVAWHSTAEHECRARSMPAPRWPRPDPLDAALLWVADFSTSPTGERVTISERVNEIRTRYSADSPVIAALDAATYDLQVAQQLVDATFRTANPR